MRGAKFPQTFPWRMFPPVRCSSHRGPRAGASLRPGSIAGVSADRDRRHDRHEDRPREKGSGARHLGEDLVATVPEVAKYARVEVKNVSNVPSDYMDPPRWVQLTKGCDTLARPEVAGVIVSHGTDTLEETAWLPRPTVTRQAGRPHRRAAQRLRARTSTVRATSSTRRASASTRRAR